MNGCGSDLANSYLHAGTKNKSINIVMFSWDTMTPVVECCDTATLTPTMGAKHSQTTAIDVEDKTTGVERNSVMSQPNHKYSSLKNKNMFPRNIVPHEVLL